ncbi:MAG: hypothetical protein P4L87_21920 [Formivibrio sp.]|nr:hypothetical protein [Formivibrio sp.]
MPDSEILQRFDTLAGYQAAIQVLIAGAQKRLWFCEQTLRESGLGSRMQHDMLVHFLRASATSTIRILLTRTEYLLQECPRLLQLFNQFPHRLEIRTPIELTANEQQCYVIADEGHYLKRYHSDWLRGEYGIDRQEAAVLEQRFNLWWEQASTPSEMHQLTL